MPDHDILEEQRDRYKTALQNLLTACQASAIGEYGECLFCDFLGGRHADDCILLKTESVLRR